MDLEQEKLKIQKTQMYLQIASVVMSAILLYVLINGKKEIEELNEYQITGED